MKTRLIAIALTFSIACGAGILLLSAGLQAQRPDNTPASVQIRVTDDEGDTIEDAAVRIQRLDGTPIGTTQLTDASGEAMVHFPRGGAYRVVTTLPDGYDPLTDSDGTVVDQCAGQDVLRCISAHIAGGRVYTLGDNGIVSRHPLATDGNLWVQARDREPEPRLHVLMKDRTTGQIVPGGTLSVNRVDPAGAVFGRTTDGDEFVDRLQPAQYDVQWTPPSGYVPDGAGPLRLSVQRLTTIELFAKPVSGDLSGTALDPDTSYDTGASVHIRDARTNELVGGGEVRWTWYELGRAKSDTHTPRSGSFILMTSGDTVVELLTPPPGYVLVGQRVEVVSDRSTPRVTFRVQRTVAEREWRSVSPDTTVGHRTAGGETVPPTTTPTTVPPTTVPPTTVPPTTEAPPNTVGPTRPRCDIPVNYELCLELGLITPEQYEALTR